MRKRTRDTHLPRCVYRHHGAYFYVKGGKWMKLGTTLPDALAAYARFHEAPAGGMGTLIDEAMVSITAKVKPSTARQYRVAARRLKQILFEFSPEQVKPKHVAAIKVDMKSTPNMANRYLSLLRQIFDYALEQGLVESNPALGIKRHEEAKRSRLITAEEFAAIRAKAGKRLQVIMDLLSLTGQRVNDVLRIRRADLTDDGIRFTQQKTGAKLIVRWSPALRAVVDRINTFDGNVRALTLFRNRNGKAPDYGSVHEQWSRACRLAGVSDARLHDLRAMSITQAQREGKNPTALAGHTNAAQTVRYLRDRETPIVDGPTFEAKR
jgi:integrase